MIVVTVINFILMVFALFGFVMTIFGTPIGIVLLLVALFRRKKTKSKKILKIALFLLSGIPTLVLSFLLYALLHLIATFFGINMVGSGTNLMPLTIF